jgi:general secretion pathway protein K
MVVAASRATPPRTTDRGIALVVVLWAVVLLGIMAQAFVAEIRTETKLTRNLVDDSAAKALADGGVYIAIGRLSEEQALLNADGGSLPPSWQTADGLVDIAVQDEDGKIDLNTASDELLSTLFKSVGLDEDAAKAMTDKIADWKDRDNLRRLHGAEDDAYGAAGLPYGAKDKRFDEVDELRLVLGMTPALYASIAPALTTYNGTAGVDPEAAAPAVLQALLPGRTAAIDDILAARQTQDAAAYEAALERAGFQQTFISRSSRSVFTVRAVARTPDGGTFVREAVVRLGGRSRQPYEFLAWRRGGR